MDEKNLYGMMVKLDERQKTIFNMLRKVESHLNKLNGKVEEHEKAVNQLHMFGAMAIVLIPLIWSAIMRWL